MKKLILFTLFVTTMLVVTEQNDRSVYSGIYVSTGEGNLGFLQVEEDIGIAILRCEYLTNFNGDNRIYAKMQFQVYKVRGFRFFVALPPFHGIIGKDYNTPLNAEIMWKDKLLINTDVYRDGINFSAQFRYKF